MPDGSIVSAKRLSNYRYALVKRMLEADNSWGPWSIAKHSNVDPSIPDTDVGTSIASRLQRSLGVLAEVAVVEIKPLADLRDTI